MVGAAGAFTVVAPPGVSWILGAVNGFKGVGAIWDLSGSIPESGLPSKKTSEPLAVAIKLSPLPHLKVTRHIAGVLEFHAFSAAEPQCAGPFP